MQTLYNQISDVLEHTMTPTIIAPKELQKILKTIKQNLKPALQLPYALNSELLLYYKHIKCTSIVHNNGIMIIMAIPIISEGSRFLIYKILNTPIPNLGVDMSVKYDIPYDKLVLSTMFTNPCQVL